MLRFLKIALKVIVGFFVLFFSLLFSLWLYQPLDEWIGFSHVYFDDEAKERIRDIPKDATKVYLYRFSFTDGADWGVFSASPDSIDEYIHDRWGVSTYTFSEWPLEGDTNPSPPISSPTFPLWRTHGYWDLKNSTSGKYFEGSNKERHVTIFVDTKSSRIYYFERN